MASDKVVGFLRSLGIWSGDIDVDVTARMFQEDMVRGLAVSKEYQGAGYPLAMIPAFIPWPVTVREGEKAIVLDAGGENIRVEDVEVGNWPTEDPVKKPMPGTLGLLSKSGFYDELVNLVGDRAEKIARIGFCFGYPTAIRSDGDGRLIKWTKGIQAPDVVDTWLGDELRTALDKRDTAVRLLNDTPAALLSALALDEWEDEKYSTVIGLVGGAGYNIAYVEEIDKIAKLDDADRTAWTQRTPRKHMLVNIEAGNFQRGPLGIVDLLSDEPAAEQRVNPNEKSGVSGNYVGPYALRVIKIACKKSDLFTASVGARLGALKEDDVPTIRFSEYLQQPDGDNKLAALLKDAAASDREHMLELVQSLVQRAARFVASNLLGVARQAAHTTAGDPRVLIVAEGSTINKLPGFCDEVRRLLQTSFDGEIEVLPAPDNANLIGAAVAAFA